MHYKSFIFLLICSYIQQSFSQVDIVCDTLVTTDRTMDSISLVINEINTDSILPLTYLPAIPFYTDEWRNDNTRSSYLIKKDTTYILPLENSNTGHFVFPCKGKVCSPYGIRSGRMHTGMDIKQNYGDNIVAAWSGVVRMARMGYYGYGGTIIIRHDNGLETIYAHLSRISVLTNQQVKAGELIGKAGRTGRASTEHLHFETRFLYEYFNPKTIIDFEACHLITDTLVVKNGKFYAKKDLEKQQKEIERLATISDTLPTHNLASTTDSLSESKASITEHNQLNPKAAYKPKYHTVAQGDTLYKIAKKYQTSINKLCEINHIKENSILSISQKIKLP